MDLEDVLKSLIAHNHLNVMTVSELQLSDAQRLIYGRRRILDTLYQEESDKFKELQLVTFKVFLLSMIWFALISVKQLCM